MVVVVDDVSTIVQQNQFIKQQQPDNCPPMFLKEGHVNQQSN